MKAISIKQPHALLICKGIKKIELRTWPTNFRGRVLIHASKKADKFDFAVNNQASIHEIVFAAALNEAEENEMFGAIIGSVDIVDCKERPKSYLVKDKMFYWILENPVLFNEAIPAKGKLSFWEFPGINCEPEEKHGENFCHCSIPVKEGNQVMRMIDKFVCVYCGGVWYK